MSDVSPRILRELRNDFLTDVAVVVPLLITLLVLAIAFNNINVYLDLLSDAISSFLTSISVPPDGVVEREVLVEITTPAILLFLIVFVGLTVTFSRHGQRAVDYFEYVIEGIPAVGSVFESFKQMSDAMLDSDMENFQDVAPVEFPMERSYTVGPAERAGRAKSQRVPTETPPSEAADRDPEDCDTTDTNPERAAGRDPHGRKPTDEPPEEDGVRETETREGATGTLDVQNRDETATVESETPDEDNDADGTRERDANPDRSGNVDGGVDE